MNHDEALVTMDMMLDHGLIIRGDVLLVFTAAIHGSSGNAIRVDEFSYGAGEAAGEGCLTGRFPGYYPFGYGAGYGIAAGYSDGNGYASGYGDACGYGQEIFPSGYEYEYIDGDDGEIHATGGGTGIGWACGDGDGRGFGTVNPANRTDT